MQIVILLLMLPEHYKISQNKHKSQSNKNILQTINQCWLESNKIKKFWFLTCQQISCCQPSWSHNTREIYWVCWNSIWQWPCQTKIEKWAWFYEFCGGCCTSLLQVLPRLDKCCPTWTYDLFSCAAICSGYSKQPYEQSFFYRLCCYFILPAEIISHPSSLLSLWAKFKTKKV